MIRHIVLWKCKEFAEGNDKNTNMDIVIQELEEIKKEFPPLKFLECHKGIRSGAHFYDLILIMEFESLDDLQAYQVYPRHAKLHEFAVNVREARAVCDYQL